MKDQILGIYYGDTPPKVSKRPRRGFQLKYKSHTEVSWQLTEENLSSHLPRLRLLCLYISFASGLSLWGKIKYKVCLKYYIGKHENLLVTASTNQSIVSVLVLHSGAHGIPGVCGTAKFLWHFAENLIRFNLSAFLGRKYGTYTFNKILPSQSSMEGAFITTYIKIISFFKKIKLSITSNTCWCPGSPRCDSICVASHPTLTSHL